MFLSVVIVLLTNPILSFYFCTDILTMGIDYHGICKQLVLECLLNAKIYAPVPIISETDIHS